MSEQEATKAGPAPGWQYHQPAVGGGDVLHVRQPQQVAADRLARMVDRPAGPRHLETGAQPAGVSLRVEMFDTQGHRLTASFLASATSISNEWK
jgi:hypothetical protein